MEHLSQLHGDDARSARVDELACKANEGELSSKERDEDEALYRSQQLVLASLRARAQHRGARARNRHPEYTRPGNPKAIDVKSIMVKQVFCPGCLDSITSTSTVSLSTSTPIAFECQNIPIKHGGAIGNNVTGRFLLAVSISRCLLLKVSTPSGPHERRTRIHQRVKWRPVRPGCLKAQ